MRRLAAHCKPLGACLRRIPQHVAVPVSFDDVSDSSQSFTFALPGQMAPSGS
ncbi:hypothetical protein UFOVP707_25 [uncultured Caudovirales phage]|uniref:Uncharacterized protein n=1 Tax=uncultured Caudovirales phage TaxID=2100421 RepID=A0A6J5NIZ3_9CAUD|nr:hypothetical protein UFOVP707_25 [uncultured Caudovirales phage]